MMKAVLKSIDTGSPEAFESFWPEDQECFGMWLTVLIGPDDSAGGHYYQILVCTPEWIKEKYLHTGAVWGRHMLIVSSFDSDRIKREITKYLEGCTGNDFGEMAQKVARIGAWEFEDYQS